jgi:hypothetical protein
MPCECKNCKNTSCEQYGNMKFYDNLDNIKERIHTIKK